MKVSELSGAQLDYWVAKTEGAIIEQRLKWGVVCTWKHKGEVVTGVFSPSEDWSQAGPIIERQGISVILYDGVWVACEPRTLSRNRGSVFVYLEGKTFLEAAMRCYGASKFGDEVDDTKHS